MRDGSAFFFILHTDYNVSGNIKYRRSNLKGNYVAQFIRNRGNGQAFSIYWWILRVLDLVIATRKI